MRESSRTGRKTDLQRVKSGHQHRCEIGGLVAQPLFLRGDRGSKGDMAEQLFTIGTRCH